MRAGGASLLPAAALAVGAEAVRSLEAGNWEILALGYLWYTIHVDSLSQLQAGIQRYLFPELWDPIIATVLLWPAWVVFGGLGAILLALFRRRPRKRRWFSR